MKKMKEPQIKISNRILISPLFVVRSWIVATDSAFRQCPFMGHGLNFLMLIKHSAEKFLAHITVILSIRAGVLA